MKDKREITLEVYLERMAGVFLINDDELLMSKILRTDVVLSRLGEDRTASTERVQEIKFRIPQKSEVGKAGKEAYMESKGKSVDGNSFFFSSFSCSSPFLFFGTIFFFFFFLFLWEIMVC
jgi:hypothetical protein